MMVSSCSKLIFTVILVLLANCRCSESASIPEYLSNISETLHNIEGLLTDKSVPIPPVEPKESKSKPAGNLNLAARRSLPSIQTIDNELSEGESGEVPNSNTRRSMGQTHNHADDSPPTVIDIQLPSRRKLDKKDKKVVVKKIVKDDYDSEEFDENIDENINSNVNQNVNTNTNSGNIVRISGRRSMNSNKNINSNTNVNQNSNILSVQTDASISHENHRRFAGTDDI